MEMLRQKIRQCCLVEKDGVLRADGFLNHQLDMELYDAMGRELARRFAGKGINKILTVEASGIGLACVTALHMGGIPVVFAKKNRSSRMGSEVYTAKVSSYTNGVSYDIVVAKPYLQAEDRVLIIDDFLANGKSVQALKALIQFAGATLEGVGIAIEKGYLPGGKDLRREGIPLESLAIIDRADEQTGEITFRDFS